MEKTEQFISKGDVVQITNTDHHWFPALIVVSEVKSFGCQGYATVPDGGNKMAGTAYIRLETKDFERVGQAVIVVE